MPLSLRALRTGRAAGSRALDTTDRFEAGHMMYIDAPSMKRLRADLATFYTDAIRRPAATTDGSR